MRPVKRVCLLGQAGTFVTRVGLMARSIFRMACEEPRLKDASDGSTEIVAEKILELAEAGETDPARLCSTALRSLPDQ